MSERELDAAGIVDPALRAGYRRSKQLNAEHGRTYYLATLLLPAAKRPYVHALYGFARHADDIVDEHAIDAGAFASWTDQVLHEIEWGASSDPVVRAMIDTLDRWHIPVSYVEDFLDAMASDLRVSAYPDFAALERYMWGSAAVIGLQMLPVLGRAGASVRWDELEPYAIDLGIAFQLTNFIRDVADDLLRGRVYIPADEMAQFGVDVDRLRRGVADEPTRNLLAHQIERARSLYSRAAPGIELVDSGSRECLRVASTLYGGILDAIEAADYDVFARRAVVPVSRRVRVGAGGLVNAWLGRRQAGERAPDVPHAPIRQG
jgi:phytoene synthase